MIIVIIFFLVKIKDNIFVKMVESEFYVIISNLFRVIIVIVWNYFEFKCVVKKIKFEVIV